MKYKKTLAILVLMLVTTSGLSAASSCVKQRTKTSSALELTKLRYETVRQETGKRSLLMKVSFTAQPIAFTHREQIVWGMDSYIILRPIVHKDTDTEKIVSLSLIATGDCAAYDFIRGVFQGWCDQTRYFAHFDKKTGITLMYAYVPDDYQLPVVKYID